MKRISNFSFGHSKNIFHVCFPQTIILISIQKDEWIFIFSAFLHGDTHRIIYFLFHSLSRVLDFFGKFLSPLLTFEYKKNFHLERIECGWRKVLRFVEELQMNPVSVEHVCVCECLMKNKRRENVSKLFSVMNGNDVSRACMSMLIKCNWDAGSKGTVVKMFVSYFLCASQVRVGSFGCYF